MELLLKLVDTKVYTIHKHATEIVYSFFRNNFQSKKQIVKLEDDKNDTNS